MNELPNVKIVQKKLQKVNNGTKVVKNNYQKTPRNSMEILRERVVNVTDHKVKSVPKTKLKVPSKPSVKKGVTQKAITQSVKKTSKMKSSLTLRKQPLAGQSLLKAESISKTKSNVPTKLTIIKKPVQNAKKQSIKKTLGIKSTLTLQKQPQTELSDNKVKSIQEAKSSFRPKPSPLTKKTVQNTKNQLAKNTSKAKSTLALRKQPASVPSGEKINLIRKTKSNAPPKPSLTKKTVQNIKNQLVKKTSKTKPTLTLRKEHQTEQKSQPKKGVVRMKGATFAAGSGTQSKRTVTPKSNLIPSIAKNPSTQKRELSQQTTIENPTKKLFKIQSKKVKRVLRKKTKSSVTPKSVVSKAMEDVTPIINTPLPAQQPTIT